MKSFASLTTKKDRVSFIRNKLSTNRNWAIKGLVRIFNEQTIDEQATHTTRIHNGVGFNAVDAEILSSFVLQIKSGKSLSPKQMAIVHSKMPKYAKQLELFSK